MEKGCHCDAANNIAFKSSGDQDCDAKYVLMCNSLFTVNICLYI